MELSRSLRPQTLLRLDAICNRFEADWQAAALGRADRPRIGDFAHEVDGRLLPALLPDLLALDVAYRRRLGEVPLAAEYPPHFPPDLVAAALAEAPPPDPEADGTWGLSPPPAGAESAGDDTRAAGPAGASPGPPFGRLGDFRILREIGRGGMGVVFEAEQVSLGRRVAIKLLNQRMTRDAGLQRRFEREARAAARLHHTNIVPVFGSGEHDGTPYYVMQYIRGTGLDVVVEEVARLERGGSTPGPTRPPGTTGSRDAIGAAAARSLVTGDFPTPEEPEGGAGRTNTFAGGVDPSGPQVGGHGEDGRGPTDTPTAAATPGSQPPPAGPPTEGTGAPSSVITAPGEGGREARKLSYWQGVARIGAQAAAALEYAHRQGVVHRDIKPSNLLLDTTGTVWVTDFGLAKADGGENLTHTGDVLGTLRYMPPEAFEGKADARSDVYSLGLTLYELLALRPAFDERDRNRLIRQVTTAEPTRLRKLRPAVPRDLETVVHKAVDRDPVRRYQAAADLAADLRRFVDDEPIRARRQTAAEAAWRWARRHKAVAALVATVAVVLVAVTVGSVALAAYFREQEVVQRDLVRDKTQLVEDKQQLADANEDARRTTERALRQAETTLVDMQTSGGLLAAERGDAARAVLWFAKAAEGASSDPGRQADNLLRARNWARGVTLPVGVFAAGAPPTKLAFRPGDTLLLVHTGTRFQVWDWRLQKPLPWADGRAEAGTVCWSPDGAHLAVGLPAGGVQIRSVPDGTVLRTLAHPGPVAAVAYSPDGASLAVGGRAVHLWDTRDPTFLTPNPSPHADPALKAVWAHPQPVVAVAFNTTGDRVATSCRDGKARVFSAADRTRRGELFPPVPHTGAFPAPVFGDKDRVLVTVTGPRELSWWDAGSGAPRGVRPTPGPADQFVAGPRGDWLAFGTDPRAELWDMADRDRPPLVLEHRNMVTDFAFAADGKVVVTTSWDHTARVWTLPEGRPIDYPLPHMGNTVKCAISDDATHLAVARFDGQVCLWKRPAGDVVRWERAGWATRPRPSPDGRLLAPGYWHETPLGHSGLGSAAVLDARTGKPAGPLPALPGTPFDSCVCADNRTAATLVLDNGNGWLALWDVSTGRLHGSAKKLPGAPRSVAARPHSSQLAVLCQTGDVLVFDFRTGERIHAARPAHAKNSDAVAARAEYTPDGSTLVTLGADSTVHAWDAQTCRLRYPPIQLLVQDGVCRSFAISPDGALVATAVNGKNAARVWDLATGRARSEPLPHPGDHYGLFHLCFSPDGRYLLTGCKDGQARLWDWRAGTLACPPLQHSDEVYGVAFSPDGRYAVTAVRGAVGTVHTWEVTTGKPVAPPVRLRNPPTALARSADGTQFFACTLNQSVFLLDLAALVSAPVQPMEYFALLGELTSAHRVELGGVSGLTWEQWREKGEQFSQKHQPVNRLAVAAAVARGAAHRLRAQRLVEAGRPLEAVAAWRSALDEIDRSSGDEPARRSARADILDEARDRLELRLAGHPDEGGARGLADLLLEGYEPVPWTVLRPAEAASADGATLTRLPDGSVLASGANPDHDTYTVRLKTGLRGVTAVRLEALPDPSLPAGGPGRHHLGTFHLTEITPVATSPAAGDRSRPVRFVHAAATYVRPQDRDTTRGDGPWGAIDGSHVTRWDIWPRVGQPNSVVFDLAEPFGTGEPTELTLRLDFRQTVWKQ